ncbi:hypothetical protein SS50377_23505 [Spironucleus salmonicida]|uniref:Uncharacterized protein n=1 Tax=Spironucleus salmonicida TaxID=348837 RepID=V6LPS7_9EUKA|nr:hypothetical protein SS50377_23505 [Spironucleus salmonicida]|eukprot:EST46243.1 Hypothetical protein SS50377_13839 [Spironucleus salmonicida]
MQLQRHHISQTLNFKGSQLLTPPSEYFNSHKNLIKPLAYYIDAPSSFDSTIVIIDQKQQFSTVIAISHSLIYKVKNIQLPDPYDPIQALALLHPRDSYIQLLRKTTDQRYSCKKQQNQAIRNISINGELFQYLQKASDYCQKIMDNHKVCVEGDFSFIFTDNLFSYENHTVTIEREQKLNRVILIRTDGEQATQQMINEKQIDGTLFIININIIEDNLAQIFVYFSGIKEREAFPYCEEKHYKGVKIDIEFINWLKLKIINCDLLYQTNDFAIDNIAAVASNSMEMQFLNSFRERQ